MYFKYPNPDPVLSKKYFFILYEKNKPFCPRLKIICFSVVILCLLCSVVPIFMIAKNVNSAFFLTKPCIFCLCLRYKTGHCTLHAVYCTFCNYPIKELGLGSASGKNMVFLSMKSFFKILNEMAGTLEKHSEAVHDKYL